MLVLFLVHLNLKNKPPHIHAYSYTVIRQENHAVGVCSTVENSAYVHNTSTKGTSGQGLHLTVRRPPKKDTTELGVCAQGVKRFVVDTRGLKNAVGVSGAKGDAALSCRRGPVAVGVGASRRGWGRTDLLLARLTADAGRCGVDAVTAVRANACVFAAVLCSGDTGSVKVNWSTEQERPRVSAPGSPALSTPKASSPSTCGEAWVAC